MVKVAKWRKYLENIYYSIGHTAAFISYGRLNKIVKAEKKFKIQPKKKSTIFRRTGHPFAHKRNEEI